MIARREWAWLCNGFFDLYPLHDGGVVASGFTPGESKFADAMARHWDAFVIQGEPKAAGLQTGLGMARAGACRTSARMGS